MNYYYFDTETYLIAPAKLAPKMVCLQSAMGDSAPCLYAAFEQGTRIHLTAMLRNPEVCFVGHNVAFDMAVLGAFYPALLPEIFAAYVQGRVLCTQVRERLRAIEAGEWIKGLRFDLATLAKKYGDTKDAADPWRLRYAELDGIPVHQWPEDAVTYARHDVEATRTVFRAQGEPSEQDFVEARHAFWLHLAGCWGVKSDPEKARALAIRVEAERAEVAVGLRARGWLRVDGSRDTKAVKAYVLANYADVEDLPKTDGGDLSIGADAAEILDDDALREYARYSSLGTILSGNVEALKMGLIQPRYESVLETGRTSATGGHYGKKLPGGGTASVNGLPVQTLRKEPGVRECIVARPGKAFVQRDYSMLELHTWAQTCQDWLGSSALGKRLNAGIDVHCDTGARLRGLPYGVVLAGKKTTYAEVRQSAKAVNFGLPGMLGAKALVAYAKSNYGVTMTLEEAFAAVAVWHEANPEARPYFALISNWTGNGMVGSITLPRSRRTRGGCKAPSGANYGFQGPAADLMKHAGWEVTRECYTVPTSPLFGARLPLELHDELIVECDADRVHEVDARLTEIMEEAGRVWCPDFPPKTEGVAMAYWSKDAKRAVEGGRLQIWEG